MPHHLSLNRTATSIAAILLVSLSLMGSAPLPAWAGDNQVTGDIAGNPANLGASNTVTINSTLLTLVKAAFLTDGTPIASGASVARGTSVKFLIYVDNTTSVPVDSVNVQDALVPAFVYQAGSIRVSNTVNTGAAAAAIYAATDAAALITDAVTSADVAGISGATLSAGDGAGNAVVSVPAGKVWAVLFTVKVL